MEQKNDIINTKNMNYTKIVVWNEEDKCYIGSAPPLIGQCCHGDTEEEVLAELDIIVDDWLFLNKDSSGQYYPSLGKFTTNIPPPENLEISAPKIDIIPGLPCRFNPNVSREEMNKAYQRSLNNWNLDGGVE